MKKSSYLWLSACLFLSLSVLLGNGTYTLPVPDGGVENPSPPSLVGILKGTSTGEIIVLPKGGKELLVIKFTERTMMFTVAGGIVWPDRLVLDGPIEICFTHETLEKSLNPPVAAVIRVETRKVP